MGNIKEVFKKYNLWYWLSGTSWWVVIWHLAWHGVIEIPICMAVIFGFHAGIEFNKLTK